MYRFAFMSPAIICNPLLFISSFKLPYLRYNIAKIQLEERQDSKAKAKDTTQTTNITIGAQVLRFLALHLAIHL
jgi:hypothetical protein